ARGALRRRYRRRRSRRRRDVRRDWLELAPHDRRTPGLDRHFGALVAVALGAENEAVRAGPERQRIERQRARRLGPLVEGGRRGDVAPQIEPPLEVLRADLRDPILDRLRVAHVGLDLQVPLVADDRLLPAAEALEGFSFEAVRQVRVRREALRLAERRERLLP